MALKFFRATYAVNQGPANYSLGEKPGPTSWFLQIKFYWHSAILACLRIVHGCFPAATAEMNFQDRDCVI